MSDSEDTDTQLYSLKLISAFRRKTQADHFLRMMPNDSLVSPSDVVITNDYLFSKFFIVGTCPGDNDTTPRLLYSLPFEPEERDDLSLFCFPHGTTVGCEKFKYPAAFIQAALSEPQLSPFVLYFPSKDEAPYFFCATLTVNPFTMPSVAHDLSCEDIFTFVQPDEMPTSQICIVIQTRFPYYDLYFAILKWFIQCETIGKYSITVDIDHFMQKGKYDSTPGNWPESHRNSLQSLLESLQKNRIESNLSEFNFVDQYPFPALVWKHPISTRQELPLARYVVGELINLLTVDQYIELLSALCLEKSIIVVSHSQSLACNAVLALHFMIWPLKWVAPSISQLPDSLLDVLDSPSPLIVSTTQCENVLNDNAVILNLDKKQVFPMRPFALIPRLSFIKERLTEYWRELNKQSATARERDDAVGLILSSTNITVRDLVSPVQMSIISEYADTGCNGSRFIVELFLKNFEVEERGFMKQMVGTQMMQFFIEGQCRNRTKQYV